MTINDIAEFILTYNQQLTVGGTILSAIAAVFSAFVAIISMIAAFWSAFSARRANDATAEAEKRFHIRTAISDAHAIEIECDRIKQLSTDIKLAYQSLAVFNGGSGGSREQMHKNASNEKYEHAKKLSQPASELTSHPRSLDHLDAQALDIKQVELSAALMELIALRERMIDELSEIRQQNSDARNVRLRR